jgi:S-formylglutathione hydrolase FrmB
MKVVLLFCFLLHSTVIVAGTADTIKIYSAAMKKEIPCVVIRPDSYPQKTQRYPVVYLLHGYSGNYSDWIKKVPALLQAVDRYQTLIVCPDGGYSSWYFDSPIDSTMRYETHIVGEVVPEIDRRYRTLPERRFRAITGLSMGGHGALFLAWRHAGLFAAAGSMSGGVDLNASRNRFDISKRIGDTIRYAGNWSSYSVHHLIETPPKAPLALLIDCGTEDFFFDINQRLHNRLLQLRIRHDYVERPGSHNWAYWQNAVEYQLLYFHLFFKGQLSPVRQP